MTASGSGRLSTGAAVGLLVTLLVVVNITRSAVVPSSWHFVLNMSVGLAVVGIGLLAAMNPTEMGTAPADLAAGLRWGGTVFALITVGVLVGGALGLLGDERTQVSAASMAWRALVVIPIGTVVVEELAFRGVLQGLLDRLLTPTRTLAVGAILFGLWHVFPAWRGGAVQSDVADVGRAAAVAGTLVATTAAGVGFGWLRQRSGSVVAPMLAHLATNSVTFALSWAFT